MPSESPTATIRRLSLFQLGQSLLDLAAERSHRPDVGLGEHRHALFVAVQRHLPRLPEEGGCLREVGGPGGEHAGHEQAPGPLRAVLGHQAEPLVDPVPPLRQGAGRPPVRGELHGEAQPFRRAARGCEGVLHRGPDVGDLAAYRLMKLGLGRRDEFGPQATGRVAMVFEVPPAHGGRVALLVEALGTVFTDRVQEPVARPGLAHALHDRLVHQAEQRLQDRVGREPVAPAHPFRGRQLERSGEDGQACPQQALRRGAELVGPADGRTQRLVPGAGRPLSAGEHLEPAVQPGHQLGKWCHPQAYRGQFESERDSVEPFDQCQRLCPVGLGDGPAGQHAGGPLCEQFHGVVHAERRDRHRPLVGNVEGLPASVASTHTSAASRSRTSQSTAQASIMCSQVSSTMSSCCPLRWPTTASSGSIPAWSGTPSTVASVAGTSSGSERAESSASHTPSGNRSRRPSAARRAVRLLPTPPGPTSVTSRTSPKAS